jgi:Inosine-uridine preferring nucleoside hydrolase/FmdE, Molybdenum formylmethanofuran dehydrogenase operon
MKRILIIIICLALNLTLFSHPWKPSHYVIIDTDAGIDDIRAISMLLASPDVRVLAITVSPGALSAENAYLKVKSLLNSFWHEGVPVGINRKCEFKSPDFPAALKAIWGNETGIDVINAPDCISVIKGILNAETTKVSFICLGGLSTVSLAAREIPAFRQQVKEIIWSSDGSNDKKSFNYQIDVSSAEKVIKGDLLLKCVTGFGREHFYDEQMINRISLLTNVYSARVSEFFKYETGKNHDFSYAATDEMVPVFLHYPGIFQHDTIADDFVCPPGNIALLKESVLKILAGETISKNQVIRTFPSDSTFYSSDVEPFVAEIIRKYGMDEWVSSIITNELHRHLGVFSIIGVKMGIRAREYFDTGVDEFSTISFAGSDPPLSCINDGLQVSTGSTPGHGLLTVMNDPPSAPKAEFRYMNRKIRLTLKPQFADKIVSDLKEINFVNGLDSNIYWELVRKNSLKYWRDLDRHIIFIIEEVSN